MRHLSYSTGVALLLVAAPFAGAQEGQIQVTLTGDWTGAALDGTEVTYTFTKEGGLVWRVKEPNFMGAFPDGLKGKYEVRVGKPSWEIDIFDFGDPRFKGVRFRGILEVIDAQSFKMEGRPSNQAERPKEFGREAIVFRPIKK